MAEMLIDGMTGDWDPEKYHDTYRDDLMALIHRKIESGQTEVLDETPVEEPAPRGEVIDIMALLKKSVEATQRGRLAADTAANAPDEDEEEEKKPRAKKAPAKGASTAKPKSAEPARPRSRARKTA
jgi:DNA end-binding protein Ku